MNPLLLTAFSVISLILLDPNTKTGVFVRSYWFESGIEHGNPTYNSRFRVNAPETGLSEFKDRDEARGNGMMLIRMEEDLTRLESAELVLELWGGHPGTENKRVTINGRGTYAIPEVGTAAENCTYSHPVIPLKITDLVNGYNAIQFACDQGKTFWGHYIVDNACLRTVLKKDYPLLKERGLDSFHFLPMLGFHEPDRLSTKLQMSLGAEEIIESVDYYGFYSGYDENGDTEKTDWHGMTKDRKAYGHLCTSTRKDGFGLVWDTSMLPAQENVAIRAVVHFKDDPSLTYVTEPMGCLSNKWAIPEREDAQVKLIESADLPHPFWSRAGEKKTCTLPIDIDPARIEKAELHVRVWDGGAGNVKNYFTLNGHPLAVAGSGRHDLIYSRVPIDPKILKQGENRIEVLSDTEHHGIEILLPGPALMIRYR